ncbi:putative O-antigen export system, permease protein RfbA [Nitrospira japonica]|uniref:Transport permease protein n=1 Tax=Nitrospira japonica TaxID=1325564 RepID=A0A1W1IBE1_9BACT|nr:ABC transporter permease [Nitrospira japonica]SLM50231.1 putative O-antigen export system, permease protein RfbA [Nitrospira japonica]
MTAAKDIFAPTPTLQVDVAGGHRILIEPTSSLFHLDFGAIWMHRELLLFLAWRDVKARYAQTAMGIGWALVQPLLSMAIFTVIFSYWAKLPSDGLPYPLFAFAALLPWLYFSRSLDKSAGSLVAEAGLIKKVYFPRVIIPISATLVGLVDFFVGLVLLIGMMIWYGVVPTYGVLALPFLLLLALASSLAVSLWLSAIHVKYRDIGAVLPLIIQLWMYASPVVYSVNMVPEKWRPLYSLNPMVGVIEGFRWALLGKVSPDFLAIGVSTGVVIMLLLGGLLYFKWMERTFADVI